MKCHLTSCLSQSRSNIHDLCIILIKLLTVCSDKTLCSNFCLYAPHALRQARALNECFFTINYIYIYAQRSVGHFPFIKACLGSPKCNPYNTRWLCVCISRVRQHYIVVAALEVSLKSWTQIFPRSSNRRHISATEQRLFSHTHFAR